MSDTMHVLADVLGSEEAQHILEKQKIVPFTKSADWLKNGINLLEKSTTADFLKPLTYQVLHDRKNYFEKHGLQDWFMEAQARLNPITTQEKT